MAATKVTRNYRRSAIARSLFTPTTLQDAIDRLGFVQADPIRSPARAQDLILRHRVEGYRAGDLEQHYASLDVEEDYLYAYGFVFRSIWTLLHPRSPSRTRALEKNVLEIVHKLGDVHPRMLSAHLGKKRTVNAWGGYSKATTDALEWLHWRGLVRIARREQGVRVYRAVEPSAGSAGSLEPSERLRHLVIALASIFAPSPEKSLHAVLARYRHLGNPRKTMNDLVSAGRLIKEVVDDVAYIRPAEMEMSPDIARRVRFLAPFDPIVWDRRRFEHFWGWEYRFEAYTPQAKRVRGYYAMPLLWGDSIPGWANARVENGRLAVDVGFVRTRPKEKDFARELEAETERLREFLFSGTVG